MARNERKRDPSGGLDDAQIQASIPQEKGGREMRVGIFVLLGILSVIIVLFMLTDPATMRGRYMLVTELVDAGGIRKGDPVQMRGVNIGRIQGFNMTGGVVNIIMEIEGSWDVPRDSYTRLAGQGLFGGRTMEVVPGTSGVMFDRWDTVPSFDGPSGLLGTAEVVGAQATEVLDQLNLLLAEPTISAVRGSTTELQSMMVELRQAISVNQEQLALLTASLGRSALGLETAAGAAPDVVRAAARTDSVLAQISVTARTLDNAALSLDGMLARMRTGEGTLGRLLEDDALYLNLNRAAEAIALLADDVRENPRRYIRIGIFGF